MRRRLAILIAVPLLLVAPRGAAAQANSAPATAQPGLVPDAGASTEALSQLQIDVACAPPPVLGLVDSSLHVLGVQDPAPRSLYGSGDLLVLDGGNTNGVQLGQEFFLRRAVTFGERYTTTPTKKARTAKPSTRGILTSGWVRVVAVSGTSAIATVEHACGPILRGDTLQPFAAPAVPPEIATLDTTGELDFMGMSHVLFGDEEQRIRGNGDFMLIDRGASQGVVIGSRFGIFRDLRNWAIPDASLPPGAVPATLAQPLIAVGEAVAVATGPSVAVVRILGARDAIEAGDFVVPRRPPAAGAGQ